MVKKKGSDCLEWGARTKCRIVLIALFMLVHACVLWSLDGIDPIDNYLVDVWTDSQGLEFKLIRSIAQTNDGFLWIATEKDLIRYDGVNFEKIQFASKENDSEPIAIPPDALFVDKKGVLWIGSEAGLTMYRFQDRSFITHSIVGGMENDRIRTITEDHSGNVWVSSYSSFVGRFSKEGFTYFDDKDGLIGKKINAIIGWSNNKVLVGTRENGAFVFDGKRFRPLIIPCLGNRQIIKIHVDRFGDLWIGTDDGLFRFIDSKLDEWLRYSIGDGLPDNFIATIEEDEAGNLWGGTESRGIALIQHDADGSLCFDSMLESLSIISSFIDREYNLWIGTLGSGLFRLKKKRLSSFKPLSSYPSETISSIFQNTSGVTYLGTESGTLFRLDRGNVSSVEIPQTLRGANLFAIAEDRAGHLWLGTNGKGAFCREQGEWRRLLSNQGLADNLVTTIFRDHSGDLWFGSFDGVSVRRTSAEKMEILRSADGLLGKVVHAICEDKNQNILVTTGKGLTLIAGGLFSKENIKHLLEGISVTCVRQDASPPSREGDIVYWVATYGGGLKRLKIKKDGGIDIETFDREAGLPTNHVSRFFEDDFGYFWILSDVGILRVGKASLNKYSKHKKEPIHCWVYGESEGVSTFDFIEFARHIALKTKDGEFWFASKKEILKINPSEVKITSIAPTVMLESVRRDGTDVPVRNIPPENIFKGKADWNFRFTSPSLSTPEKVRFKYRLGGLSDEWEYLPYKADRMVEYKNLKAGEYHFEVFACNADGIWSAEPATYSFVVEAFFTETATFKGLVVVSFMGLIGLSIYFYILWKNKPEAKRLPAYHGTQPLHPDFARECLKKLDHQMKVEKIYADPELTLKKLADSINVNTHTLSRLLNDNLDVRFSEFVNTNRIDEAKRILTDPKRSHVKIIGVGLEVGFNTMPAFYNAFKKNTGMTPSAYKKAMKKKKK